MNNKLNIYALAGINNLKPRNVLTIVSTITGFSIEDIQGRRKENGLSDARTIAAVLFVNLGLNYCETGREMGGFHHTSIMYQVRKFDRIKSVDTDILVTWAKKIHENYGINLLR
jgi:chromosomal replication initiation ATPase DnaA